MYSDVIFFPIYYLNYVAYCKFNLFVVLNRIWHTLWSFTLRSGNTFYHFYLNYDLRIIVILCLVIYLHLLYIYLEKKIGLWYHLDQVIVSKFIKIGTESFPRWSYMEYVYCLGLWSQHRVPEQAWECVQ